MQRYFFTRHKYVIRMQRVTTKKISRAKITCNDHYVKLIMFCSDSAVIFSVMPVITVTVLTVIIASAWCSVSMMCIYVPLAVQSGRGPGSQSMVMSSVLW